MFLTYYWHFNAFLIGIGKQNINNQRKSENCPNTLVKSPLTFEDENSLRVVILRTANIFFELGKSVMKGGSDFSALVNTAR